ncbi:hypothetical protein BASA50_007546 [Batrachochytrium salamandrivorans]|uniref:Uncharacterized protein n=1 Tax=Batrachochytrium salamandrivorans TaxID=1357716 RepID=A0ABQ8F8A9_9FUNG|nr:hypothetical protein BASA50_007546 [Batrachochytrium salamandrivorans]
MRSPIIDVCEDLAESSLIHVNDTVDNTVDDTVDELLSSEVANGDSNNLPHIDMCFASVAEIEAQSLVEVVEVLEVVGAVTAQPHTSVHRTKVLEQALKKICVPTMRQKNGIVNEKIALVDTIAPKRSQSNRTQNRLLQSTSLLLRSRLLQVRIPHAWEADLPATPKKERFHVKPKKPQTHSVTQASGRQNISGDVRNHPDLISTVKKNRHNTNRDGQPKIGSIKWK